ncbi:enoyl-CoA hydratase/isomerase family protein, partial [Pseudomonas viridiflava]|uniref:enoyl-CoA hydratase/isomerase family protein n=1 Tax=Pseudomonas viridiflava TaxID=33069 RepID=UPI0013CF0DBB
MSSQASSALPVRRSANRGAILVEVRNHIGHLTLNRPAGLNALDLEMVRTLRQQLDAWADDEGVYAVVLRGAGGKAFCAGGDIRSLYESHRNGLDSHQMFFAEEYALDLTIHGYRKPVMALMDGLVLGLSPIHVS